MQNQPNE